jgi:hypothetical protein
VRRVKLAGCFVGVFAGVVLLGCGKKLDAESAAGGGVDWKSVAPEFTAQQVVADPELLQSRLRQDNPGYQKGAEFAINPQFGLVGQINLDSVTNIAALHCGPFAALDLRGTPIKDISPLAGVPLVMLGLEDTQVTDLSPLHGGKLTKLYLNNAPITDIGPLAGLPLDELMLVNNKVFNLKPLAGMPLKMLWLNNNPVSDITPLVKCPLMSLTLEGTQVKDISPLAGHPTLKRLHIGNTPVADLTPLKGMKLQRLIFTPGNITNGLDVVRSMTSLREIGTSFENRMAPDKFWAEFVGNDN